MSIFHCKRKLSYLIALTMTLSLLPANTFAAGSALLINGAPVSCVLETGGEVIVSPTDDEWGKIDSNVNEGGLIVFEASGFPSDARKLVIRSDAWWYDNSGIRTRYELVGYGSVAATNGIFKNVTLTDGKVDVIIDLFTLQITGRQNGKMLQIAQDETYTPFIVNTASQYTVRGGDTLSKIATRYGMSWQQLAKQNPQIKNPDRIYRGQVLNMSVEPADYSTESNWLSIPKENDKPADVFYVYPTAYIAGPENPWIAEIDSPIMREAAKPVFNEHTSVYAGDCNVYAPYYRQIGSHLLLNNTSGMSRMVTGTPSIDVIAAFDYYIENYNGGRPFILAGHSQGTEALMTLLPHIAGEHPEAYKRMVAGYLIGSSVTENYLKDNPQIKFAQGADDTGVIISYNTEMPDLTAPSPIVKPGAVSINPLNWKTDDTYAPDELNLGDLKVDAQINLSRGTVACSTVEPEDWKLPLPIFPLGCYHGGDYVFYGANLKQNVADRIAAYFSGKTDGAVEIETVTPDGSSEEVWALAEDAYTFALPLVIMDATAENLTNTVEATSKNAPVNQLIHSKQLASASTKSIVTPNVDTVYSQAFFDLSADAMVLRKPATDRFCSLELLDAYTNCAAILGTGGDTQEEAVYLLTGPSFNGETPEGMKRVPLPTNMAWMLGRTIVENEEDLQNVYKVQEGMALVPLSAYLENGFDYKPPKGEYKPENEYVPVERVIKMTAEEFFTSANELMLKNPPTAADAPMLARIAEINVGPGLAFDASVLGESSERKWTDMLGELADELIEEADRFKTEMGAWSFFGAPIADFGTEYQFRALVALGGLGANPVSVAIYPKADMDDGGQVLTGENSYRIHFDAPPPTMEYGFWSVTAYGEDNFLIDNPLNRYNINDRSKAVLNGDGSLDILVQSEPPENEAMLNNWLPVKEEQFHLFLRIYLPAASVLDGTWKAPSITEENS